MYARRSKEVRWGIAARLGLGFLSAALLAVIPPASAQVPAVGVACTQGPNFNLSTSVGYIKLPDGNTMFMWGFSEAGKPFQHPGPVLCVNAGQTVTIVLQNDVLDDDVSIIFPGQEGVLANGVPAQPQFDSSNNLVSLTNTAKKGGSVTYSFVASRPGTYLYESGTEPQKQVRMGLFGALVVRPGAVPAGGAGSADEYAYDHKDSRFTRSGGQSEEFMVLLSEIDPFQHQAAEAKEAFNLAYYHPRYWLVNGRAFPDTIADNFASFLPSQPYGALARIHPLDAATHPSPGLIRYLSVGSETFPFHPHGNNGRVIGRDGNLLRGPAGEDLSFEKFAINIGPGQTWDVTFSWHDAEKYSPYPGYTPPEPFPVTIPNEYDVENGMFYSGSPFLGAKGPLPVGFTTLNQCGEYYIITHNHALYQITSWGLTMSGAITYLRIDPPTPNLCP